MNTITNLTSAKGNKVVNQFSITIGDTTYFQSYDTTITKRDTLGIVLDVNWDWSATTLKYLKQWLGTTRTKAEIYKAIADGTYTITRLN